MIYKSDTGTMTYGQNAGPHAVTSAGGYFYQYDANGNMIQGKNKTLSYDAENRLIEVNQSSTISAYSYDGDGGRVKKTSSLPGGAAGTNEATYIGSLFEKDSSGKTTKHIFAGSNRVASVESTGNTYYYHSDHLGSSNIITNQSGQQVQYCEYTPYGSLAKNEGEDAVKYKFTGKELDSTGLYFYGARYYDPEIGRFITADTIIQAPYDSQSLNRYSYCRNNPINYIDPTGHSWLGDIFKEINRWFGQAERGLEKVTNSEWDISVNASYTVKFGSGGATNSRSSYSSVTSGVPSGNASTAGSTSSESVISSPEYSELYNESFSSVTANNSEEPRKDVSIWNRSLSSLWVEFKEDLREVVARPFNEQQAYNLVVGFSGGMKFVGKGGPIVLGRFKLGNQPGISYLRKLAEKFNARVLDTPFPNGVTLRQGLQAEIDAASKIYFRMKGVKSGYVSYDIELKYIRSKLQLMDKTEFMVDK